MIALFAQVATPAGGISPGLFTPLLFGTIIYVLVLLGSVVLENHDDARATTLDDVAFVVLLLLGLYTAVLLITALAMEFPLIIDMLRVVAVVVVFFVAIVLVLFAFGLLFAVIGRMKTRKKRVTTG
ncbi:MAG: hypothetical protein ACR2HC_04965 [Thermoleophilaceae bacterium]